MRCPGDFYLCDVLQGPVKTELSVSRFCKLEPIFVLSIGSNPLSPQLYRRKPGHISPGGFPINRSTEGTYQ
jgi:hypothetical protein